MPAIDPRTNTTIPTTARMPVPFTPLVLDAEASRAKATEALRVELANIDAEEDALNQREAALNEPRADTSGDDAERAEIAGGRAALHARRRSVDDRAEAVRKHHADLKAQVPTPPIFMLKVATSSEREQISSTMVRMGLVAIGPEQMRAGLIEALYHHDWGHRDGASLPDAEANEAAAEENAIFLDEFWQKEQLQSVAIQRWTDQEIERVLDTAEGAPARDRELKPPRIIRPREGARATSLIDLMMRTSAIMRDIAARQLDFERLNKRVLVRIALVDVENLPGWHDHEREQSADGTLTDADADALRELMEREYGPKLADAAWEQLVGKVDSFFSLEEFEIKNSDSPLGKQPDQNGSDAPSGDTATSGGISETESSSAPAPADASETTTDRS